MRWAACPLLIFSLGAQAAPSNPPLPPPRPNFEGPPAAPARETAKAPETAKTKACPLLADPNAVTEQAHSLPAEGPCAIGSPVLLKAVVIDGDKVPLQPAATLDCGMATAVVSWLRDDLAPKLKAAGESLTELQVAGSHECRPRNRVPGAKISEHASGGALDVRGFKLAGGKLFVIGKDQPKLFAEVKATACARFETVLGPGADKDHQDHLHLDIRARKTPHMFCQWDVNGVK